MPDFWIRYGSINGVGGWEKIQASDTNDADLQAYQAACEDFESYEGLHGTRSICDIVEEESVDEDEAEQIWSDERESWLSYEVTHKKPDDDE